MSLQQAVWTEEAIAWHGGHRPLVQLLTHAGSHDCTLPFALETPFSHVGGPGSWVPAEGAYGVFSFRPTHVPYVFLRFISTATMDTVCTRVYDPGFMGVWHPRPAFSG